LERVYGRFVADVGVHTSWNFIDYLSTTYIDAVVVELGRRYENIRAGGILRERRSQLSQRCPRISVGVGLLRQMQGISDLLLLKCERALQVAVSRVRLCR
jgi:hypothetical protein